ncbi:hypothetical protein Tco_0553953 [Tanacetum coccineum]
MYTKIKAKLALLEAGSSSTQPTKPFQSKNKGLVAETFNWDEEEVFKDKEMVLVKVLMAFAHDELAVVKNHARNGSVIVKNGEAVTTSVPTKFKNDEQESKINELAKLVQMLMDEKVNSSQKFQESKLEIPQTKSSRSVNSSKLMCISIKQIMKPKAKPFPPCTHCGFRDHRPDDCSMGGVLVESSQSSESSLRMSCNNYGTTDHHDFDHFKTGEKLQANKAKEPTKRSMTGVKSHLHKYVEQPGPKVVCGDNSSCITEGYCSINCGGIVVSKFAFGNGLKYNLISTSQLCDAKYIVQFDDKQRTISNANKEIVLILHRRNDVYVLGMSSLTQNEACFFTKASESVN